MTRKTKLIISAFLILLGVVCRLMPHAWNFAPIAGIALFAGVYLGRSYAMFLPLTTMLLGDFFIGFYQWQVFLVVYACFTIAGLLGHLVKNYKSTQIIMASSILISTVFFLLTNWAVWQFTPWYAKTAQGLIQCYILALPFFRNTLVGDIFYTAVLFGVYEGVVILAKFKIAKPELIKNS